MNCARCSTRRRRILGMDLLKEIVNYPYTIPGLSDGGAHTKFFCGGRYPTEFLASFTRDQAMLTPEEAHWKLSAWPAICAGLSDRGVLREGYAADIVMYDYDRLGIEPSTVVHDLAGRRMAARATRPRLPLHHGQRRGHARGRSTDQTDVGTVAASRQRLKRQPQAIVISQT